MLNSFRTRSNCEIEAKFIQDRIQFAERNIAEFCHIFAQYSRKVARVRDKGDEIAKTTLNYAESENINKSLAIGLEYFAESLSTISDYGDVRVQTLDTKIVGGFARYADVCKHVKEEVKEIYSARDRELNKRRQLDRIRDRNPRNRQQIIQAETDLVKATAEVSKTIHNLEEKTNAFERQKLHDVKTILLDFISIEIGYHAKTLEVLTKAYKDVDSINEQSDLEEFQKSLHMEDTIRHQVTESKNNIFRSAGTLGSLGAIFSTTQKRKSPGIPSSSEHVSKSAETLDSMKYSPSESAESENDSEEDLEHVTSSDDPTENVSSSNVIRKFVK